ncbi:MSMEG_0565 family glycosyltransferase [Jatrophihabitans sp. YIM 134969]
MRIALLTYSTKPRGGVVHTLALAEALVRAGAEVDVWSLARGGDTGFYRAVDPGVGIRLVTFPDGPAEESVGERIVRSIAVLREAFCASAYDIVHAQDCISANAVDRPVRTVHHLDAFTTPQLVACHARALRDPVAHLTVSHAVARQLADEWDIRAQVIPNGVDAARFAAAAADDADAALGRWEWEQRFGRYVLAVGGIEPRKGTADLVEAMAVLQRSRPDVPLVVAGGETLFDYRDYRRGIDALVDRLGVRVEILGTVADDALPALVAGAGAFAFPSLAEGFGLAAMEALAAGVPLVCRDLPVFRELFADSARFAGTPAGIAAALGSALSVPDPEREQAGRRAAAAHTWDRAARAHLDFYRAHRRVPA